MAICHAGIFSTNFQGHKIVQLQDNVEPTII